MSEKKGMATALVAERDGMVHVVNISKFGKLHLLKSFNVVPSSFKKYHVILSLSKTKNAGEYFFGGSPWARIVKLNVQ